MALPCRDLAISFDTGPSHFYSDGRRAEYPTRHLEDSGRRPSRFLTRKEH
jgi:hypothetical protein